MHDLLTKADTLGPGHIIDFYMHRHVSRPEHKSCTAESQDMLPCRGAQAADWKTYKQAASTWEEGQAQKELGSNAAQRPHVNGHVVRMPQQNLHITHKASVKQMLCPPSIWRPCLTACSHAKELYELKSFARAACIPDTTSLMNVMGCRIRSKFTKGKV